MAPATRCEALALAKSEGNARFKAGDFAGAARLYSAAIDAARDATAAPDGALLVAQLFCNRAAAHVKLHATDAARTDAACAAQLAPQWAKPHLRLAEVAALHNEYDAALQSLATARRLADAAADRAVAKEVEARQREYEAFQRCQTQDNQSSTGFSSEAALRTMLNAIDRGGQVFSSHTLVNGELQPRVVYKRPEPTPDQLFEEGQRLEDEEGDVVEALKLYEWAAKMSVDRARGWQWNRGIGDALTAIGLHYNVGTHYGKNETLALDYLKRGAALGSTGACNELGVIYVQGTHGQLQSYALAKAHFRRAAEQGDVPAMLNLGGLHMKLREFATAIRWAEAAASRGALQGWENANKYRRLAGYLPKLEPAAQRFLQDCATMRLCPGYVQLRLDHQSSTPTLAQLRTIKTPYGRRLLQAKKLMLHACETLSRGELALGVSAAAQAYWFDDATLVFTTNEMRLCAQALEMLIADGLPVDAGLAHVLQPPAQVTNPADVMDFWNALHEKFPHDFRIAACAAKAHSFLDGDDEVPEGTLAMKPETNTGLKLYSRALVNQASTPNYDPREMDPNDLGFCFLTGLAMYRVEEHAVAKNMLERFLECAGIDGHRFGGEAHFLLGLISLLPGEEFITFDPSTVPIAAEHLRLGRELQQRVPVFLRQKNKSSNLQMLESALRAASIRTGVAVDDLDDTPETSTPVVRGGGVLSGPACHPLLQIPVSPLTVVLKKQRAEALSEDNQKGPATLAPATTTSTDRETSRTDRHFKLTSVDDIVSGVDDQTYKRCVLECVVVAPVCKIEASYKLIVEDSRHDPIQVELKTLTRDLYDQLTPGRILYILYPRLRHAEDQSAVLLIQDPVRELDIRDARVICWSCGVAPADQDKMPIRSCSQCHRAKYCSRECQKEDWKLYGHRFCCSSYI